jgi:N-acetylglucosamine transport system permease protein
MTFDRLSFMVVFLGVPLVLFLVFVISPFVQALYYGMTDWSGFTPAMNFVGLSNYGKLWQDDIFRHAVLNNALLAVVVPFVTIVLACCSRASSRSRAPTAATCAA